MRLQSGFHLGWRTCFPAPSQTVGRSCQLSEGFSRGLLTMWLLPRVAMKETVRAKQRPHYPLEANPRSDASSLSISHSSHCTGREYQEAATAGGLLKGWCPQCVQLSGYIIFKVSLTSLTFCGKPWGIEGSKCCQKKKKVIKLEKKECIFLPN